MATGDDEGYRPFPAFAGWCDDFDASAVRQFMALLEESRSTASPEALESAVRIATRYAAVDTGAIEGLYATNRGFTRTIAEQTATWEAALKQHGEHVERLIADALRGYDMVLDLVTGAIPLSESWIRQLHQTLTASQETYDVMTTIGPQRQPLPKGVYKTMPNNPTSADTGRVFHYAPVTDTPAEMARLVDELRKPDFVAAHPVLQAAYAHYAFVRVHPFADGNGRVSRALASVFLYRSPGVPLVIFADQKGAYLDALEAADAGLPIHFVNFISERSIDTIELVRSSLHVTGRASGAVQRLSQGLARRAGLSDAEYDGLNARIGTVLHDRWTTLIAALGLPESVRSAMDVVDGRLNPPKGYRAATHVIVRYHFATSSPVEVTTSGHVSVWSARPDTDGADFVATNTAIDARLEIHLRDVRPTETEVLRIKIDNWLRAVLDVELATFSEQLHQAMVAAGYR